MVPERLRLVESFLGSIVVDEGEDDLESLPRFRRWLADHHRGEAAAMATEADLTLARDLRAALRVQARANADGAAEETVTDLNALGAHTPLRVVFTPDGVELAPAVGGVPGMLAEVLAAVATAHADGSWRRLKICRADTCQFVFYDQSKNSSRCWCSMAVCGNRSKTRAYRRRAGTAGSAG